MGKWLGIVVVLGLAAAAGWWFTGPGSRTGQACTKMQTLCGDALMPSDACMDDLEDATQAQLDTLHACVEPAESCLEVTGCLAGAAGRDLAVGALRGLLR